jgi:glutaredoxin
MMKGLRTVPQIFVGEEHIGGWDDMRKIGLAAMQAKLGG